MGASIDPFYIERGAGPSRLGLTSAYAESIRGDWIALDLAPTGRVVNLHDTFGSLTTDRASHDLRAPCMFRVLAVNPRAVANPALARLSPEGEGWLLEIEVFEDQAIV